MPTLPQSQWKPTRTTPTRYNHKFPRQYLRSNPKIYSLLSDNRIPPNQVQSTPDYWNNVIQKVESLLICNIRGIHHSPLDNTLPSDLLVGIANTQHMIQRCSLLPEPREPRKRRSMPSIPRWQPDNSLPVTLVDDIARSPDRFPPLDSHHNNRESIHIPWGNRILVDPDGHSGSCCYKFRGVVRMPHPEQHHNNPGTCRVGSDNTHPLNRVDGIGNSRNRCLRVVLGHCHNNRGSSHGPLGSTLPPSPNQRSTDSESKFQWHRRQ